MFPQPSFISFYFVPITLPTICCWLSNESVRSCWKIKEKVSGENFPYTSKASDADKGGSWQSGRLPLPSHRNDNSLRHVNKWVTHLPCSRICLNSLNGANHSELRQLWPFAKRIPAICFQVENISKAVRGGKQRSVSLSCVFLTRKAEKVNLFRRSVSQTLIRFYETS